MKRLINKLIIKHVKRNPKLQTDIITDWSKGREIAQYNILDSEVTLSNVNMIYSSLSNCSIKEITNSILKDSPANFKLTEKESETND